MSSQHSGFRTPTVVGGSSSGRCSSTGKVASAGRSKSGAPKKGGWEDAGVEFYREAYPGAIENLHDSSLRTLLPSKKYNVNTMSRGNVRHRSSTRNARKYRQSSNPNATLVHTTCRGSDTYVEVFPDLTQGADEEETWQKLQQIRANAVPMREKRELKRQLLAAPTLRTKGLAALKLSRRKFFSRFRFHVRESWSKIGLWKKKLKYIEGNFGTGLVAFFAFIKWLLFINLFSSLLIILFVVVPQVILTQPQDWCMTDVNRSATLYFNSFPTLESLSSVLSRLNDKFKPSTTEKSKKDSFPPDISPSKESESNLDYSFSVDSFSPSVTPPLYPSSPNTVATTFHFENRDIETESSGEERSSTDSLPSTTDKTKDLFLDVLSRKDKNEDPLMGVLSGSLRTPLPDKTEDPLLDAFSESQHSLLSTVGVNSSYISNETNNFLIAPVMPLISEEIKSSNCCYHIYQDFILNKERDHHHVVQGLLDFLQGTGQLEISLLFYGFYPRVRVSINELSEFIYNRYNLPLAYLLVMVIIFTLSFVLMVRKAAKGLKDKIRSSEGQFYQLSNLVFGGWDYCIENVKAAAIKKKAIFNEFKNFVETERHREEKEARTRKERCCLYFIRLLINAAVIATLIASFVAIYFATSFAFENLTVHQDRSWIEKNFGKVIASSYDIVEGDSATLASPRYPWWQTLFFEYLPSFTIVALNIVVPYIFKILIQFENYTPNFILTFSLMRTVFLRLASLVVLLFTVYQNIRACEITEQQCLSSSPSCRGQVVCWETYVGQQLYKLTILDLIIMFINTFLVNFPRKIIGRNILGPSSRLGSFIGDVEFEIPKHVLDVVYGQTLCWLGMFFSPFLPIVLSIKLVLTFYIKYFDCAVNSSQSSHLYRTSRSNSLFVSILLASFVVTIIPVGFSIVELKPSPACGPFNELPTIWTEFIRLIENSPHWLQNLFFFLGTAGFAIPCAIFLILACYYYFAVSAANKHMVSLLKHQLVLEGHDKQFLLVRLDKLIKRTRELEDLQQRQSDISSSFAPELTDDLTLELRGSQS